VVEGCVFSEFTTGTVQERKRLRDADLRTRVCLLLGRGEAAAYWGNYKADSRLEYSGGGEGLTQGEEAAQDLTEKKGGDAWGKKVNSKEKEKRKTANRSTGEVRW